MHIDYPIAVDRVLGLGVPPTQRLQRRFARPGQINRFERVLVWSPLGLVRGPARQRRLRAVARPERFPSAAARMYAVFDLGAMFYWAIPTAPPW